MILIDIATPQGSMSDAERSQMAASITSATVGEDAKAPEETLQRARKMTHVAFREMKGWTTGDGPLGPDAVPPFIVTVTVPEAWRGEVSRYFTGVVHAAIIRFDMARGYARNGGDVWINTVGIRDGSIGLNGKASNAADVLTYITEEYRARSQEPVDTPEGIVIDPICGMQVRLGPRAITLDHNGTTVGFCSLGCRAAYARHNGIEIAELT